MTIIIDGKKLQKEFLEHIKNDVALLPFKPVFCDVVVGNDPVSLQYVKMKQRTAESVGILFHEAFFKEDITTEELVGEIKKLNTVENMCGIIVQLPLPVTLDKQKVLDAIDPKLDVDYLGTEASNLFYAGDSFGTKGFPTAFAVLAIIHSLNLDFTDKKVVMLGQGQLVGKPVTASLRFLGVEPFVVTNDTPDKEKIIKEADVIISGIGQGKYITGSMIKEGVVLIDAGTSEEGTSIVGDVDQESVMGIAGALSPVPGGVGPVTVAMLLKNVLTVAQEKK